MKQVRITSLAFLCLLLIISCTSETPIEKETLAKVYVDLLLADELYVDTDSLERKKTEILTMYSIDREEYDSSFAKFEYDSEEWNDFFNLATTYLDSLKARQKLNEEQKE